MHHIWHRPQLEISDVVYDCVRKHAHSVCSDGTMYASQPAMLTQLLPGQGVEFTSVDAVNIFWIFGEEQVFAESIKFRNVTTASWVWDNDGVQTGRSATSSYAQLARGEDALVVPYQGTPTEPSQVNAALSTQPPPLSLVDEWITTLMQVLPTFANRARCWEHTSHACGRAMCAACGRCLGRAVVVCSWVPRYTAHQLLLGVSIPRTWLHYDVACRACFHLCHAYESPNCSFSPHTCS